ncbi:MAG: hypothetical protein IKF37_01365 [Bacilli bacterium]|nr:hypothetical protein [Bacilli bacterium]
MSCNDRKEKIIAFFNRYPGVFDKNQMMYILNFADIDFNKEFCPEIVREVFDELGLIPKEKNIYVGFLKLLDDVFSLEDKNIIEIGGGAIPRLGKRMYPMLGKGKVTIYDPRLSTYEENMPKMVLKREMFTDKTDTSNCDLIFGLMPCNGAEIIINNATKNKIDFMVGLCEGGPHGDCFDFYENEDEWLDYIIFHAKDRVRKNSMGKLKIKYLKEYGDPYPIIYNER